ncbi:MAG: sulfurtransferase [Burkholderiales bacterium]|nr:MAG: sulfurtransferase [Burkholderiales bacterium]
MLLAAALALLLTGGVAHALRVPGPLVDPGWLAANLEQVTVIDVGSSPESFVGRPRFAREPQGLRQVLVEVGGRIPGARLADPATMRRSRRIGGRSVDFMLPERDDFEAYMRALGARDDRPIIVAPMGSDAVDVDTAARLYWQLRYYGETNVALLDGGLIGWILAGGKVESGPARAPVAGSWTAKAERDELLANSEAVAQASLGGGEQLVDTRSLSQYYGMTRRPYVSAAGHIAGARVYPPELLTRADGVARFLPVGRYRDLLRAQGIDPDAPAITYCNSGHLSAGVWFVMSELLGNRKARMYDGSMHQWTAEGRPVTASSGPPAPR